jgi:hypothetical protein
MTEFHWITLGLGLALVAGVWGFNKWQEWRFRKQAAAAFARNHPDVLLDTPKNMRRHGEDAGRLEPTVMRGMVADDAVPPSEPTSDWVNLSETAALAVAVLDPAFDYIAEVHPPEPVAGSAVPTFRVGKRIGVLGLSEADEWEVVQGGRRYQEFRIGVQLVDRQGAVTADQLVMFCEQVNAFAERLGGVATFPRREDKLRVAQQLDAFCAEVDIAIGINVTAARNPFPLSRVSALAESAGLVLEPDGAFHARSESGKTLFTLTDRHHRPLDALDDTPALSLQLDLPRVAGAEVAFDRMADLAQQLALTLGGDLVDDENRSLKPADLAVIRKQIVQVSARMDDRGIPAGGAAALRLFS